MSRYSRKESIVIPHAVKHARIVFCRKMELQKDAGHFPGVDRSHHGFSVVASFCHNPCLTRTASISNLKSQITILTSVCLIVRFQCPLIQGHDVYCYLYYLFLLNIV